jgi:hypothetical protein
MGPRTGLDDVEKEKTCPSRPARSPVAIPTELSRLYRWEDHIQMYAYLEEVKPKAVDWIHLTQDRNQWTRQWTIEFSKKMLILLALEICSVRLVNWKAAMSIWEALVTSEGNQPVLFGSHPLYVKESATSVNGKPRAGTSDRSGKWSPDTAVLLLTFVP